MSVVVSQLVGQVTINGVSQAQQGLSSVGTAATTTQDKLSSIKPFNAGKMITDVDVATANLTLIESKVTQAREKLETLQNSANAGNAVTGIAEAEAGLTILEAKAQQARTSLSEIQTAADEAARGLQQVQPSADAAATALLQVDKSTQEADSQLSQFFSGLQKTAQEMAGNFAESVRSSAGEMSGSFFSGIQNSIGGLLDFGSKVGMVVFGLQNLYQGAISVGQAFLEPNATMEQTTVSFQAFLGVGDKTTQFLSTLSNFAAKTPFSFPDAQKGALNLLNMGIAAQDVNGDLTNIGDAVAKVGGNGVAFQAITGIIEQMGTAGKITTGDMMQLTDRNIPAFQILAKAMGVPVATLQDMISHGELGKDKIDLLIKSLGQFGNGAMVAQGNTFNGLLSTFQDNVALAWRSFTGPLFDRAKGSLKTMGDLVSSKVFQDFATGAGKDVMNAFDDIGNAVAFVGDVFRTIHLADFSDAWKTVSMEVDLLFHRFTNLSGSAKPVADRLEPIGNIIRGIADGGLKVVTALLWDFSAAFIAIDRGLQDGTGPLGLLKPIFADVSDGIKHIDFKAITGDIKPFVQALLNMSPGVETIKALSLHAKDLGQWFQMSVIPAFKGADPGFKSLGQALSGLLPAFETISRIVGGTFQSVFTALLPVFEKAIPLIIKIAGIVSDGLGAAIKFLTPYIVQAVGAIGKFADEIATRIAPILEKWFDSLSVEVNTFLTVWNAVWPVLAPILKGVWDEIMGIVKIAWALIKGIIEIGLDILSGNWKQAWADFKTMLAGVWDGIKDYLKGAWEVIKAIFTPIGKWFGDRWHDVQNIFAGIGAWFSSKFGEAKKGATSSFDGIGAWFGDRLHDIQGFFVGIGQWFHDRFMDAYNGVTGVFSAIGTWFRDRFNDIKTAISPFTTFMHDVFQTIWNILVAVFGIIGTWFHDRFNEVMASIATATAPFRAWFHDRWNDIVGIFGKIGQWFHDRFVEVMAALTTVLSAIGTWFQNRRTDIYNVFLKVGSWFHDRFVDIWNALVAVLTPIGAWFRDRWNNITAVFANIGRWFHDRFVEAYNSVTSVFGSIGKFFSDKWAEVVGGVNTFKNNVIQKFTDAKTATVKVFHDLINGIVDHLNDGISAIEKFINFFGQGLDSIATALHTQGTIPVAKLDRIPHYAKGTPAGGHPGGPAILGEKGPEAVFLPRGTSVLPHTQTEQLLKNLTSTSSIPGYANGIGDVLGDIGSWIGNGAKSIVDTLVDKLNLHLSLPGGLSGIGSGIFNQVKDWAVSFVSNMLPKFDMGGDASSAPGNVTSWIKAAMTITGAPGSWLPALTTIAMHESGGNPDAINRTDSNALAGHPSEGLFQTIASTFSAYAVPGHNNIFNGTDNAVAAVNYIKATYGSVFNVPGIVALSQGKNYIGYANGGIINEPISGIGLRTGTNYSFGERGAEMITPMNFSSSSGGSSNDNRGIIERLDRIAALLENGMNLDGQRVSRALLPSLVGEIRNKTGIRI